MIHTDHLGGSNIITDGQGNVVQQVQYTPYGKISYELNLGVSVNYLYTGQQLDRETGLYYYNARYYDPDIGRFIQPDTVIPNPTDSQAYNRYAYCRNNPIMLTDPSGHEYMDSFTPEEQRQRYIDEWSNKGEWGQQRIEMMEKFDLMLPRIAGMEDDDAVRTDMIYKWAMSGGSISDELQAEIDKYEVSGVEELINYYVSDTIEDESGDWTDYITLGGAIIVGVFIGVATAGIGAAAAAGMGLTVSATVGAVTTVSLSLTGSIVAGAIAGAISGGAMAALTGQNIVEGILMGAAIGAVTAGITWGASKLYNHFVGWKPKWESGHLGTAASCGKGSSDMPWYDYNNIGFAEPLEPNDVFGNMLREGGLVSNLANRIPGINSVSYLHDVWQNVMLPVSVGDIATTIINPFSMLPAAAISYTALLNGYESVVYNLYVVYQDVSGTGADQRPSNNQQ